MTLFCKVGEILKEKEINNTHLISLHQFAFNNVTLGVGLEPVFMKYDVRCRYH